MWSIITSAGQVLFSGGRVLKLLKSGVNITQSSNPLGVAKNITLTVVDCCCPPAIKVPVDCVALRISLFLPVSPIVVGFNIHLVNQIYEECLS